MHSSSADQSNLGVDVSIHVKLYAIFGRNPPQAFLKWIAGVSFQESYFTSSVKRRCCSTLTLQVYSLRLLIVVRPWSHCVRRRCCSTLGCSVDLQACNLEAWNESVVCSSVFTQTDVSASNFVVPFKEWTMSSVRPSNSGCTRIVGRARR